MGTQFPACPPTLKPIQHFMKLASEHDERNMVVSYWARLYALQVGLKLKTSQPEETQYLLAVMDWLENVKKDNEGNDSIINEVVAQAYIDNYAMKMFSIADKQDRDGNYGKNIVKAYYSCGVLYDILQTFGELTDENVHNRKYAKYRAAYIHNCLKNGETPVLMPQGADDEENATAAPDTDENNEETQESAEPPPPPPSAEEILENPDKLPSPPKDEDSHQEGGFKSFVGEGQPDMTSFVAAPAAVQANVKLNDEQMQKAQKYCKYAGNSLNYDDVKAAVEYLQKALTLLTTGQDS